MLATEEATRAAHGRLNLLERRAPNAWPTCVEHTQQTFAVGVWSNKSFPMFRSNAVMHPLDTSLPHDAVPNRRAFLTGAAALLTASLAPTTLGADEFSAATLPTETSARDLVLARARALSAEPYRPDEVPLPDDLAALSYDGYRRLDSRHERAVWRDGPSGFEVQPLHRGFIYHGAMELNVVEDGRVSRVPYDPSRFRFPDGVAVPEGDIGHSGARLLASRGTPSVAREFAVFQGASYFRALAAGLSYGLSARGLAIDTASPRGEEFPDFRAMWFERPEPGSDRIVLHALLDGPAVVGAYTFTVRPSRVPGEETRMGVNATLIPRRDLDHVGIAPLTSMYWFGPLERGDVDEYRPRVHDSDGLAICTALGEWLWRPLANPSRLQVSQFDTGGACHGFGLVQRIREAKAFEDVEADYHRRPSVWVEPHAEWPAGRVELVEIPTDNEFNDNIVAYWRPDGTMPAGVEQRIGYDLVWSALPDGALGLLTATDARSGAGGEGWRQMVVDFDPPAGPATESLDPHALDAEVLTSAGTIEFPTLKRNPLTGGLRLTFMLAPDGDVAELRARVLQAGRPVTETWLYRWTA